MAASSVGAVVVDAGGGLGTLAGGAVAFSGIGGAGGVGAGSGATGSFGSTGSGCPTDGTPVRVVSG